MEPQSPSKAENWQELEAKLFMRTVKRQPITLVRGLGARVWDAEGKEYLDFVAGWAVNSLGHCHPAMVQALQQQAHTLIHVSNQFYTIPQVQLAQILVEHSCLDRVFFCNSGAEANEGAMKLARRYGKLHLDGAYEIVTTRNSFHGRTLAMVAATGQNKFQEPYIPLPNGFVNVDYDNVAAIKAATGPRTCAVMLEPVQGEGGVNVPDKNYLKEIKSWCDQKGILLILDEIQTGIGRMGTLFAYEQYGVEPDIMTLAKGLGSGIPIGAFLAKERVSVFVPGEHGSTFGGSPLICAASLASLKFIIENDVPCQVNRVGQYFVSRLEKLKGQFDFISEIRGGGLLIALGFTKDIASEIVLECLKEGLLVNPVKPNAIRFMPPLVITEKEVDEALDILKTVFNRRSENGR
ncbi:MAG: aspartate aminotransferase family protein [Chloroflexi bacterium]|nr:aspartate aminotransferase family protein [Chloroflexota bacterium]MBM3183105.1 aspartate aminotransferase family protein [Chloroflexota bacterium]MBM4452155.1 aspartate aminotransferase family protein [Chloroflexota bacterium]